MSYTDVRTSSLQLVAAILMVHKMQFVTVLEESVNVWIMLSVKIVLSVLKTSGVSLLAKGVCPAAAM